MILLDTLTVGYMTDNYYFNYMNTSKEFNWMPFHVVACTSEDFSSPGDHLSS